MVVGGKMQLATKEKQCLGSQNRKLHLILGSRFHLGHPIPVVPLHGNDLIRLSPELEISSVRASAKFAQGSQN